MIKYLRRFVSDAHGNVVIWQRPNTALIIWFGALLVTKVLQSGTPHDVARLVSTTAIVFWASQELLTGVNYFRRSLGLVVLLVVTTGFITE